MGLREECIKNPNIMFRRSLNKAKERASKRGLPISIDKQYIIELFNEQEGKCYYSGLQLNIIKSDKDRVHDPLKMSLDCVDSEKGYIRGNVVWCAYCVNSMKQKMPVEDMIGICRQIVKKADGNI